MNIYISTSPEFYKARDDMCRQIEQYRDNLLSQGCVYSGNGFRYQADETSRSNLMLAHIEAPNYPPDATVAWLTADNQVTELTKDDIAGLMSEMSAFMRQCYERSFALKSDVRAMQNKQELESYDIEGAWNG